MRARRSHANRPAEPETTTRCANGGRAVLASRVLPLGEVDNCRAELRDELAREARQCELGRVENAELDLDPRREWPHDDAAAVELACGEGIDDGEAGARRGKSAGDHRERRLH